MKPTFVHRDWPPEEGAEALAAQWQREAEQHQVQAGRDLLKCVHDLEFVTELDGLTPIAHANVADAIRALRAALDDQYRASRP